MPEYLIGVSNGVPVLVPHSASGGTPPGALLDVREVGSLNPANATALLNQAMSEAYSQGRSGIFIPPLPQDVICEQLVVKKGMSVVGGGIQATRLKQPKGVNKSLIINDPVTLPPLDYMHWSQIRELKLVKDVAGGAVDTVGSGVEINCRTGEDFLIEGVNAIDFPECGYRFLRGGVPCELRRIRGFRNGQYMLDLQRTSADNWQQLSVYGASGDNNGRALIRVKTAGAASEVFFFGGVKSETSQAGKQPNVFELDTLNTRHVIVQQLSAVNSGANTGNAIFKILGSGCRIHAVGVAAPPSWPWLIDDAVKPAKIAHNPARIACAYSTPLGMVSEILV